MKYHIFGPWSYLFVFLAVFCLNHQQVAAGAPCIPFGCDEKACYGSCKGCRDRCPHVAKDVKKCLRDCDEACRDCIFDCSTCAHND